MRSKLEQCNCATISKDKIIVRGLRVPVLIGVLESERHIKQELVVDLEVAVDINQAAVTDNLQYTLDYSALKSFLIDYMSQTKFFLIEALAEKTATAVLHKFQVPYLRLSICKKPIDMQDVDAVCICVERWLHR